jgi:methionyl-tRNA formyltransferase
MKCVYLGLPQGARALQQAGHELVAIGLSQRPTNDLPTMIPDVPILSRPNVLLAEIQRQLLAPGAPLLVCFLWDRLLPAGLLRQFPLGVLNYHPSLLPRHRGPDPYFWTIWSGDSRMGVSIMELDEGMDTGPVIAQKALPTPAEADAGSVASQLDALGLVLMVEVLAAMDRQGRLPAQPQDARQATDAPFPSEELLEIDWTWPNEKILRLLRAAAPHPGAFTFIDDDGPPLIIEKARQQTSIGQAGALVPGDAVRTDEGVVIWTGAGGLVLEQVRGGDGHSRQDGDAIATLFPNVSDIRPR